jgi:hypothetical protein
MKKIITLLLLLSLILIMVACDFDNTKENSKNESFEISQKTSGETNLKNELLSIKSTGIYGNRLISKHAEKVFMTFSFPSVYIIEGNEAQRTSYVYLSSGREAWVPTSYIKNNYVYYNDYNLDYIYKTNLMNNSDTKTLVKGKMLVPNGENISFADENGDVYSCDFDGENIRLVQKSAFDEKQMLAFSNIPYIVTNNKIFDINSFDIIACDKNYKYEYNSTDKKIEKKNSDDKVISTTFLGENIIPSWTIDVVDGWMFIKTEDNKLYAQKESSEKGSEILIKENFEEYFYIFEGRIYTTLFSMKLDGSDLIEFEEVY